MPDNVQIVKSVEHIETSIENEFDFICAFETLEHVGDLDLSLENIHKALTKTG